ncbi:Alpha/Beta hydrolase protein [Chytriomyces cf. hyalinus JEL632]|nr:Alpha/Beta hydrolase protein [Chytriomyces cf. hyalinus JEL632]
MFSELSLPPRTQIAPAAEQILDVKEAVADSDEVQLRNEFPAAVTVDRKLAIKIANMKSAKEIIVDRNYPCEEHDVISSDSALVKVFRIPNRRGGSTRHVGLEATPTPAVLLWHGLGLTAACWVCNPHPDPHANFGFLLADSGLDVWLVNGRGVIVKDHLKHAKKDKAWDFSIDEVGYLDVPAVVDYILRCTHRPNLSFVGFSQGTAAALTALSVNEKLNKKINVFIGLGPSVQPSRPENKFIHYLMRALGPSSIYHILGNEQFLGAAQHIIQYLPAHVRSAAIRRAFHIIFGWDISTFGCHHQQAALLSHSFNGLPVKNVVQWFQIIEKQNSLHHYTNKRFPARVFSFTDTASETSVKYPLKHISTNIHLFAGELDNLCDITHGKAHLPPQANLTYIPGYNHLDLIWAKDAKSKVWDLILPILHNPVIGTAKPPLKKKVSFHPALDPTNGTNGSPSISEWLANLANPGSMDSNSGFQNLNGSMGTADSRSENVSDIHSDDDESDESDRTSDEGNTRYLFDDGGIPDDVKLVMQAEILRSLLERSSGQNEGQEHEPFPGYEVYASDEEDARREEFSEMCSRQSSTEYLSCTDES